MVVIKAIMYPQGRKEGAYTLGIASLACIAQARRSEGDGERAYDVKLFKAPEFRGPTEEPEGAIWRQGIVRGHQPTNRGVWDLLGGALGQLLKPRLDRYREISDFSDDVGYMKDVLRSLAAHPDCPSDWAAYLKETAFALENLR